VIWEDTDKIGIVSGRQSGYRLTVGTKRLPLVGKQFCRIQADIFHAGIVRGNRVAVNINIQTGMVDKFTLISS